MDPEDSRSSTGDLRGVTEYDVKSEVGSVTEDAGSITSSVTEDAGSMTEEHMGKTGDDITQ